MKLLKIIYFWLDISEKFMNISIIGGGIVGCAAAYYLSKSGYDVTLIEKDEIASKASGFSFGGLLPPMVSENNNLNIFTDFAINIHKKLFYDLSSKEINYGFRKKNSLILATNDQELKNIIKFSTQMYFPSGQNPIILNHGEISHIDARISDKILGGLYINNSYDVDAFNLCSSLWYAAKKYGAKLIKDEVISIDVKNNSVRSIVLKGSEKKINSQNVILAAGPWSKFLTESLGIDIPLKPLKGQILRFDNENHPDISINFWWGANYISTKYDGYLWAGTTEEDVGFNQNIDKKGAKSILSSCIEIFPYIEKLKITNQTACLRPITSDLLPIIENFSDEVSGLVLSTGGGRNGILFGPAMGYIAAEMILSKKSSVDTSFLNLKRFNN